MSLESVQRIAVSGLANASAGLSVIGQNVANAGTAGYVREISTQTDVNAAGIGMGVLTGSVRRDLDLALQGSVQRQDAVVANLQTRQQALQSIDAVQGATGSGTDLASLVTAVQTAFATLGGDPANATQQQSVVAAAGVVAAKLNTLAQAVAATRQAAHDGAVGDVAAINADLASVGQLNRRIVGLQAQGGSTADLESQRDAAVTDLNRLVPARASRQANGAVTLITAGGLPLPTDGSATLSLDQASVGTGQYYPGGGLPGIRLGSSDVSASLGGGQLGARITLRDATLPQEQAALDGFAQDLAARFDAQGLRLFTDATGAVPVAGPVATGFAGQIRVNAAVTGTPALVRDGTQAVAGDPAGASAFTPNPPGGPAGSTVLIQRVLNYVFGDQAQPGVAQPAAPRAGLGASGTVALAFAPPTSPAAFAAAVVGAMAGDSAAVSSQLATETGVQTSLQARLTSGSGVSVDTEMSAMVTLQNAYGANARVISTLQSLWSVLLAMGAP